VLKLGTDEEQVREVLEEWALATRQGRQDDVLAKHRADVIIEGQFALGDLFEDIVRATFCLQRTDDAWKVTHQHISKPFENE
jgi:ketosteroid isomerase-like protein